MKIFLRMAMIICFVAIIASCQKSSKTVDNAAQNSNNVTQTPNQTPIQTPIQTPAGPSLIELAKKEGKVIFYTSTTKSEMDPLVALFKEKYGIPVEYLVLRGNEMLERIKVETRTGKFTADIADAGPTTIYTLKKEDYFVPNKTEDAAKILGTDPDGMFRGTLLNVYGILVNTKLVAEKDMPKTLKDLLDPKWKGKILADDPRAIGGAASLFSTLMNLKDYGRPYLENLAKQNITFTRQYLENEKVLARGEYSIYIPALGDSMNRLQGTPVKWISPDDFVYFLPLSHGILKNAPHPNAAKLFSDFIISKEAQKILAKTRVPARVEIEPDSPDISIKGKKLQPQSMEEIEKANDYFPIFAEIFK